MKISFLSSAIAICLLTGLLACKNNSNANPATPTPAPKDVTDKLDDLFTAVDNSAKELCNCQGVKDYFAATNDALKATTEKTVAAAEDRMQKANPAYEACKTATITTLQGKYGKEKITDDLITTSLQKNCPDMPDVLKK